MEQFFYFFGIGFSFTLHHGPANQEVNGFDFSGLYLVNDLGVFADYFIQNLFEGFVIGNGFKTLLVNNRFGAFV